jgi:CHAT domain-containing protein
MPKNFENAIDAQHQQIGQLARKGAYREALALAYRTYEAARSHWRPPHFRHAHSLHLLGELHRAVGDQDQAGLCYATALGIHRALRIPTDSDSARRLHDLACFLADEHGYSVESDDPLYQNAYQLFLSTQQDGFPCYTSSQHGLACVYAGTDRIPEALGLLREAAAGDDVLLAQVFAIGSEAQRAECLRAAWAHCGQYLSLVYRHARHTAAEVSAALELTWRRKALGAEALTTQREAVLGGRYPALVPVLRELNLLRRWITRKILEGPGAEGERGHLQCLQRWHAERTALESKLARLTPETSLGELFRAAQLPAIAAALPPDATLIEYVRIPLFDFHALGQATTQPLHYLAFVISNSTDPVELIDLGQAESIDRLITECRAAATGRTGQGADAPGRRLRAAVFDPLANTLGTRRRLLLAPDGDLTRLPFEVLPLVDGRPFIDSYRLSYLTVGRDVLRFQARPGRPEGPGLGRGDALVAADPDFDLGLKVLRHAERAGRDHHPGPRLPRDLQSDLVNFPRLPGTRIEGERIARRLGVSPLLDEAALEGRLKNASSPRVLHLATHGFFLPDLQTEAGFQSRNLVLADGGMGGGLSSLGGLRFESPMLRSGLALAGANTFLKGGAPPKEAEDGFLTAEDVMELDLLDTELVVLSACETGLGEVHIGEGVFGLRRAFIVAGAKTLVMSLWKVPDLATAFLMDRLYDNLLTRGLDRDLALRDAQQATRDVTVGELRVEWLSGTMIERLAASDTGAQCALEDLARQPGSHQPFEHPFYWAAFICQGDTAPLPAAGKASG